MLVHLPRPDFPVVLGVIYDVPSPTFEADVHRQVQDAQARSGKADLNAFMAKGRTWSVS